MVGKIVTLDFNTLVEIAFQLFNTLILFYLLSKLLHKPVSEFMRKRREGITHEITEANDLKEEALRMKEEYEKKLSQVHLQADEIIASAHKKASQIELEITRQAKEEAQKLKMRAEADLEMAVNQVKDDMKKEMIDVANVLAHKFIQGSIDEKQHKDLINEAIGEMSDVKWLA